MIPSEYRLEAVVARLVERLEGARPTFVADADRAHAAFREIAERHVEAAVTEYRDNAVDGDPEAHAAFLRREVLETVLPRYTRTALAFGRAEVGGFGFRALAGPIGVPALVVVAFLALMGTLRFAGWWEAWPFLALELTLPAWPSIAAAAWRRWYLRQLEALVVDAERIQENDRSFMSRVDVETAKAAANQRPRTKEVERG